MTSNLPGSPENEAISKISKDPTPCYSLQAVAQITRRKESDILHYGYQRRIILITPVPDNVQMCAFNTNTRFMNTPSDISHGMLALESGWCWRIDFCGREIQSDFKICYKFDGDGKPKHLSPNLASPMLGKYGSTEWVWRSTQQGNSYSLKITKEEIYVAKDELIRFLTDNSMCYDESESNKLKTESYRSEKLEILAFAAETYWSAAHPDKSEYPEDSKKRFTKINEDVKAFLLKKFKSEKLATAGVRLILPEYAGPGFVRRSSQLIDDGAKVSYVTNDFKALEEASNYFWAGVVKGARVTKNITNAEVADWLHKEHGLSRDYLADAGAKIIRPDSANKRKPKAKQIKIPTANN